MKKLTSLSKLTALASAMLLVTAYVAYRAGAFDWLMGSSAVTTMGGTKSLAPFVVVPVPACTSAETPSSPPVAPVE